MEDLLDSIREAVAEYDDFLAGPLPLGVRIIEVGETGVYIVADDDDFTKPRVTFNPLKATRLNMDHSTVAGRIYNGNGDRGRMVSLLDAVRTRRDEALRLLGEVVS